LRALDLYCGSGGVTKGLLDAGFDEVVGIELDQNAIKHFYKHPNATILTGNVLLTDVRFIREFDFVWSSPPCQKYSVATKQHGTSEDHPDLVAPTRELLLAAGKPFVIENVPGAPIREDLMLCGLMVNLPLLRRHRVFEIHGFDVVQPEHPKHEGRYITVTGNPGGVSTRDGDKGRGSTDEWREAMGIDWMTGKRLREAIPPAYSEYIGRQFLEAQ